MSLRTQIDLDAYVHARRAVLNDAGGRGYEDGVRVFDCPFCGDEKGRGWVNVIRWTAGCWNSGCPAEPRLEDGALDWVIRMEGFAQRREAWGFLRDEYPLLIPSDFRKGLTTTEDFCRMPREARPFTGTSLMEYEPLQFCRRQWSLTAGSVQAWGLRFCPTGAYAFRVIIPIVMGGRSVAFQARSWRNAEPKYLTSSHGVLKDPRAECGRPARALLFHLDGVPAGSDVLLVEGCGDVMAWHPDPVGHQPADRPWAMGVLGLALSPEKLAFLSQVKPRRIIVATDNETPARKRAFAWIEDCRAWGLPAVLGEWQGAKDAGSGARLVVHEDSGSSFRALIEHRLAGSD